MVICVPISLFTWTESISVSHTETASSCSPCPVGHFADVQGLSVCSKCEDSKISIQEGSISCKSCPTFARANVNRTACECIPGYYLKQNKCETCPTGGDCNTQGILKPLPGYWQSQLTSDVFYKCPNSDACDPDTVCKVGYEGVLCTLCSEGYFSIGQNVCSLCPDQSSNYLTVVFGVIAGVALALILFLR